MQLLIDGISLAALYGLLGIGFLIIFDGTRVFHVAHASVVLVAGTVTAYLWNTVHLGLLAIVLGCLVAIVAGVAMDFAVYRPIQAARGGLFGVFIASTGITFLVEAAVTLATKGAGVETIAAGLPTLNLVGLYVPVPSLVYVLVFLVALVTVWLVFFHSRLGLQWRAAADNADLARALRIPGQPLRLLSFAAGSLLAAAAGVVLLFDTGVNSSIALRLLFVTVAAVTFAGMRLRLPAVIFGSLVMGVLTSVSSFLAPEWTYVLVFAVILVFLAFLPKQLVWTA